MKGSLKYFFFFLILPIAVYGQQKNNHNLILKANVTSLIDVFSFPTVQLGLEKGLSKNISLSMEFGYQLYSFDDPDTVFTDENGMKANIEIRYYGLLKKLEAAGKNENGMNGFYAGLNLFYRQNKYNALISYEEVDDSLFNIYDDSFAVFKQNLGVNLVIGYQVTFLKRLTAEGYTGIGFMAVEVENTHREYNSEYNHIYGTDLVPFFSQLHLSESSQNKANLTFGIRLGILL